MHRAMGCAHATIHHELSKAHRALARGEAGQGTVEYIGLILLLAAVMAVVASTKNGTDIGGKIVGEINKAIDSVSKSK
jgi:hypothetical protein